MKKIYLLSGIILLSIGSSFGYYPEGETANVDLLEKAGYSDSMLQLIDLERYQQSGAGGTYERRYQPISRSKLGRAYTKLKLYFDPVQDDGKAGERQIEFSNTWLGDKTHYSSILKRTEPNKEITKAPENQTIQPLDDSQIEDL